MKPLRFSVLVAMGLVVVLSATGCKTPKKGVTPIPRPASPVVAPPGPSGPTEEEPSTKVADTDVKSKPVEPDADGTALAPLEEFEGMLKDSEIFKANTVYFDFDRSAVKAGEKAKIEPVAAYLKGNPTHKLLIEGHCDERGTEEYNRALGDRRASALRDYLVNMGVSGERIRPLTWGESKLADLGHDDAAHAKNRRGEFTVLRPKPQ